MVVAPASLASAALTNTGAESYGAPVAPTCIARTLYAAGVPSGGALSDGAASLIAWLQGGAAQRALAEAGAGPSDRSGVLVFGSVHLAGDMLALAGKLPE